MSCNTCTTVCTIHPCYDDLWIAKASVLTKYRVEITHIPSGRRVNEEVTSDGDGYVILTGGTWADFLNGAGQYRIKLYESDFSVSPSVTNNVPADFNVITGFGGAYYDLSITLSSTQYDCILFDTEMIYDSVGSPVELDDQYLINEDA